MDGDLSLKAEQAVTADIGAELTFADQRWLARATWFRDNYTEQIAYAPSLGGGGDGIADYVNIDGSRAAGLELELALQRPIGGLTASASYALRHRGGVETSARASSSSQDSHCCAGRATAVTCASNTHGGVRVCNLNLQVSGDRHDKREETDQEARFDVERR